MAIGKLAHTNEIIFGSALNKAAHLEKATEMPRVTLSPKLLSRAREEIAQHSQPEEDFIRYNENVSFLHILSPHWPHIKKLRREFDLGLVGTDAFLDGLEELKLALPIRFRDGDDRVKLKIRWMASYINSAISEQALPERLKIILPCD